MKFISMFFVAVFLTSPIYSKDVRIERFERVVQNIVESANNNDYEGVRKDFDEKMAEAFPEDKSTAFFKGLSGKYGKIKRLDGPKVIDVNKLIFPAFFERGVLDIKIILNDADKIAGLWFLPHTPRGNAPEKNSTVLSLPFKGEWFVFWGGDTEDLNYHHNVSRQRYAFDFVVVDKNGKTFKGNGSKNEDYYAFGKEMLAPADGLVTDVITGVRDNIPGSMNPSLALGNAVFIQHRGNEVSIIAHLKYGSTKVKVGDKVKRGQVIGLCGNSGNSSEPHLHYHLQNTPVIQDGIGIKVFFDRLILLKDGKEESKQDFSPVKGDIVKPATNKN
jgi:hypothetical protein